MKLWPIHWTRKRALLAGSVVILGIALPISWWTFREKTAEAQNPMGDAATEAVADTNGSPAASSSPVAPAHFSFGSSAGEAQACMQRLQTRLDSAAAAQAADSTGKYLTGRKAGYAKKYGWFPAMPEFREASILPCARIVAYYGHPSSARMGVLGEYPKDEMLRRWKQAAEEWRKADPSTPVVPALHMVSVVAQGDAGTSGKYRTITADKKISEVYSWAKDNGGIFIVDIQTGQDDIRNLLPRFEWILKNADVHLAIDPEFYMRGGVVPGRKIGTMYGADINYASNYLAELVAKYNLPPKVLIVHRFTRPMIQNYKDIKLRPEVNLVINMDGWGAPWLKADSFQDYVVQEPVQFTGFKLFYHNDTKKGDPLMTPAQLLQFHPVPLYIQYQ